MRNHSCENVFRVQVHFLANQTNICTKGFETEAQSDWEMVYFRNMSHKGFGCSKQKKEAKFPLLF